MIQSKQRSRKEEEIRSNFGEQKRITLTLGYWGKRLECNKEGRNKMKSTTEPQPQEDQKPYSHS